MSRPYLVEVRTGGELKEDLREIIYDVADEFGVRAAAEPRAVPHITLFGPYDTNRGAEVKRTLIDVLNDFDAVPYRVSGFDTFADNRVIYANVVPSSEFRSLRRRISRELRPLTAKYPDHDTDFYSSPHITVAFRDVGDQFQAILEYVNREYDPQFDEYATRVTSLRRRNMLWEYDLPAGEVLTPDKATSAHSWERTIDVLEGKTTPTDHDTLAPEPNPAVKIAKFTSAKLRKRW